MGSEQVSALPFAQSVGEQFAHHTVPLQFAYLYPPMPFERR
jgi:hypothetical protein